MLPFSVAHVRFVSVECRISFSEVACSCLRLAQVCRAPVLLWRKFYVWTQTFWPPSLCWRRKNTSRRNGMFGSTVFCLLGISCDSARWCNLIPRVRKKKLNAASSWPFSFLSCVCALRFLFPLACVAMETSNLRKLLSWVFTWRDYWLCVWMQTFSAINLYILRCTLQWAVFPNSVFKLFQLVVFCKHLLNLLHTGVNWTKCQWWPFQVQYLQREGGRVHVSYVIRFLCPPPPYLSARRAFCLDCISSFWVSRTCV